MLTRLILADSTPRNTGGSAVKKAAKSSIASGGLESASEFAKQAAKNGWAAPTAGRPSM